MLIALIQTSAALVIRTAFPHYQEFFTFKIHAQGGKDVCTGKMYVGKYFTEGGLFDEQGFKDDVATHLGRYARKEYREFEYNHSNLKPNPNNNKTKAE